ncbi:MAG: toll/interleukin-1 receptor domain-containing protein [Kiritimatiellia bacterium]
MAGLDPARDLPRSVACCGKVAFQALSSWSAGKELVEQHAACAVLVPLTRLLLKDPDYRAFVEACVEQASEREEFRFYLHLVDLSFQQFADLARADDLAGRLADTVNIPGSSGAEALVAIDAGLAAFLKDLADIEDAPRCRGRLLRFFAAVSALSAPLGVGALGLVALSAVGQATARPAPGGTLGALVAAGEGYLLLTTVFLILAQREYRWPLILAAVATGGLIPGTAPSASPCWAGSAWPWEPTTADGHGGNFPGGSGRHASREPGAGRETARMRGRRPSGILYQGHVLPRRRSVFLSYARRTWCEDIVRELRSHLRQHRTECFLDIADIELGVSWRHALENGIRRATLVVFFDQDEPRKPPRLWHRAELLTAEALRARTGLPTLVVVTPESAGPVNLAVYREKLKALTGCADFHIVPLSAQRTAAFARTIAETPPAPAGGAGRPLFDLFAVWPAVLFLGTLLPALSWLSMLLFLSHLSLALPVAKLVLPLLGSSLPIPFGALSAMLFLAAGSGFRGGLHSRYETAVPLVRTRPAFFPVLAALHVAAGASVLVHAAAGWWILSAAGFLLGFVSLDHAVRSVAGGPAGPACDMRGVPQRM